MIGRVAAAVAVAVWPAAAGAQGGDWTDRCATGALASNCTARLLTNFGGYVISGTATGRTHVRMIADWGVVGPAGRNTAVGATFFASVDDDGILAGPALRIRRIVADGKGAIEGAVGVPIYRTSDDQRPSLFGMIKFSPSPRYGLALRPEVRSRRDYDCQLQPPYGCIPFTRTVGAVSAGVEFDGLPGVLLTGGAAAALLVVVAIVASSD